MFRPMRRASRAIPEEAAKHLLQQSRRGVLAVNGDNGYPFAIPVNYYYDQEHDRMIRYALPFTATNTLSRATGHLMCRAPWCLAAAI